MREGESGLRRGWFIAVSALLVVDVGLLPAQGDTQSRAIYTIKRESGVGCLSIARNAGKFPSTRRVLPMGSSSFNWLSFFLDQDESRDRK